MNKKQLEKELLFSEAREQVLLDYLAGNIPQDFKIKHYTPLDLLDRANFSRIFACGDNNQSVVMVVADWLAADVEDALRLDGCDEFLITNFDAHFEYETCRIWFDGVKRHYREIGHGSAITVNLLPAGTSISGL